jgi:hypothetical protein
MTRNKTRKEEPIIVKASWGKYVVICHWWENIPEKTLIGIDWGIDLEDDHE